MPERRFDGLCLKSARVAAGFRNQAGLGKAVGASRSAVAAWEGGRGPDPERLPAIADALRRDINQLFPREGAPDLADLRCDAGYAQYQAEELVRSRDSVGDAERGIRRLTPALVTMLAEAYGVAEKTLRDAEDRSFGVETPAPGSGSALPTTLAAKLDYLLEHMFQGDKKPPSDAEIARRINSFAGAEVITEEGITDLHTGAVTEVADVVGDRLADVVRNGLADVFGVTAVYFQDDERIVWSVVESLHLLNHERNGDILGIAARGMGKDEEPSPEMVALVNSIVANLPQWARGGSAATP